MTQSQSLVRAFALMVLFFGVSAFADVPAVANDYINVFVDLAKGQAGVIFIVVVLGFSGFLAWRNGNLTPLLWGVAAAVLIGGAPYIAQGFLNFGNTAFSG